MLEFIIFIFDPFVTALVIFIELDELIPFTVPRDVILGCAAVDIVPAIVVAVKVLILLIFLDESVIIAFEDVTLPSVTPDI
jgi:hypothetical protein